MARVAALEGLVRQLAGRPLEAASSYRHAVTDYEQVRDLHGAAAATFNLGCTLAEIGDYGGAITAFERAIRELGRLGAVTDHALLGGQVKTLYLTAIGDHNHIRHSDSFPHRAAEPRSRGNADGA